MYKCKCGNDTDKKDKPCTQCAYEEYWGSEGSFAPEERDVCHPHASAPGGDKKPSKWHDK